MPYIIVFYIILTWLEQSCILKGNLRQTGAIYNICHRSARVKRVILKLSIDENISATIDVRCY